MTPTPTTWPLRTVTTASDAVPRGVIPIRDYGVALVSMPFGPIRRPSIQLGLLKALAVRSGFPARTFHLGLDFAARVGVRSYTRFGTMFRHDLLGDWLFSKEAFGGAAPD